MANYHHHLLFLLLLLTSSSAPTPVPAPAPNQISTTIFPPPLAQQQPPKEALRVPQLNNIIDALIGSGDFNSWANVISRFDPSMLPLSATLFIPNNAASLPPTPVLDPLVFPYHIVPQRLLFSELVLFKPFSRLPTLLPFNSILVTNNSISNFTLDGTLLSHPDLYTTDSFAVHGIDSLLDHSVYGSGNGGAVGVTAPSPPPPSGNFNLAGELMFRPRRSGAGCLCTEVWLVFLLAFSVLGEVMKGSFPA